MNLMSQMMNNLNQKKKEQKFGLTHIEEVYIVKTIITKDIFTKECKLLIKFCQICESDNHNNDQCFSKLAGGKSPTRKIVLMHVVQAETLVIQENKQQNYEMSNNEKGYGNQSYDSRPNNQNWQGNQNNQYY
jgi:hypothetical protein